MWDEARPKPLNAVQARLSAREHSARARLNRDDVKVHDPRLERARDAGERPARADTSDDGVDLAARRLEDLNPRGLFMDERVGGVIKLPRHERALRLFREAIGPLNGPGHTVLCRREDHLGAIGAEDLPAHHAHIFWHDD